MCSEQERAETRDGRRAFLRGCAGAAGGLALALAGCEKKGPLRKKTTSKRGTGDITPTSSPHPRSRPSSRPDTGTPTAADSMTDLWKGARRDEAIARLRVAEVVTGGEKAKWAVFECDRNARVHGSASPVWDHPKRSDLLDLSFVVCGYAALRTGHLRIGERIRCRGDRSKPQGHGMVSIVEALTVGCPTFFEKVASRLSYEEFRFGARLLGLDDRLPDRPAGFLERVQLYAHGRGFDVSIEDVARMARRLGCGDRGDRSMEAIRTGCVEAVRKGHAQRAGISSISIGALQSHPHPETGETKLVAWAPHGKAKFVACVQTLGETRADLVAHRIFDILAPPSLEGTADPT